MRIEGTGVFGVRGEWKRKSKTGLTRLEQMTACSDQACHCEAIPDRSNPVVEMPDRFAQIAARDDRISHVKR